MSKKLFLDLSQYGKGISAEDLVMELITNTSLDYRDKVRSGLHSFSTVPIDRSQPRFNDSIEFDGGDYDLVSR